MAFSISTCILACAINPFFTNPAMTRRLQTLGLLDSLKSPRYEEIAGRILQRADSLETFEVLRRARRHCGSHGAAFGGLTRDCGSCEARVKNRWATHRHRGGRARGDLIFMPRPDPHRDHGFSLGLLINLSDRDAILSMIGQEYETTDPGALALQWLSGLSAEHVLGIEIR